MERVTEGSKIQPQTKTPAPPPPITTGPPPDPSQDWADAFFGALNLPDDVKGQVVQILRDHAQDQALAQALATQYIRSTPWYATHFPGALEGIANGTIGSEKDYAKYMNDLNVLSMQYTGRAISGAEVAGYLKQGFNAAYVSNLYQGQAWVQANGQETNYDLGNFGVPSDGGVPKDLTALGNEKAGIDTALGQRLQNQLQQAVTRMHTIFSGSLATPSLTVGSNGLQSPTLAGGKQTPDVSAT